MLKSKNGIVTSSENLGEIVTDLLCSTLYVFESLYLNDADELTDLLKTELNKIIECNSLEEIEEYAEEEEE